MTCAEMDAVSGTHKVLARGPSSIPSIADLCPDFHLRPASLALDLGPAPLPLLAFLYVMCFDPVSSVLLCHYLSTSSAFFNQALLSVSGAT